MTQACHLGKLAVQLGERLLVRNLLLVTAESCTGGQLAEVVTSVPGSSAWFDCGLVTYSNEAKQRLLGVPLALFAPGGPGAVSEAVVLAMAAGALERSRAQLAVAVSGIAGPDGGTLGKPVGSVWVGWRWGQRELARDFAFPGDRSEVREATVEAALQGLLAWLD